MIILALLAVVASAHAHCPAQCDCAEGADTEYTCRQGALVYQVTGLKNSFVQFHCERTNINWEEIPFFPFSLNGTLERLSFSNCQLPSKFASVLARLGASDVRALTMDGAPRQLTAERVQGLAAVESIMMIDAADQTSIPYDVFDALPLLKDFRVRGAQLKLEKDGGYPYQPVTSHPALRSVELAASGITDVPPGAFLRISFVNQLYLSGNKIENITMDSFRGLENLTALDLTGNPVVSLPPRAFAHIRRLRSITFVATLLSDVAGDAFQGLTELEEVLFKFGRGNLTFGPRALAGLPALKTLTFDRTILNSLPADLIDGSTAIEELTIKGTDLEVLPKDLFKKQSRIRKLDLSDNKIKMLDHDIFWPLRGLNELNLDGNDIEEIPEQFFNGLERLTSLTANNNRLKYVADDAFQGANNLEFVSLKDNQITLKPKEEMTGYLNVVDQSPFRYLVNMKELNLQGNQISDMFNDWMWALISNLKVLDLSRNNFTYLTKADLQFLSYDIKVDLRHNHIATIDVVDIDPGLVDGAPTEQMTSVMLLDDNPFRCDCELYSFAKRLHGTKRVTAEPKLDLGNAVCASPSSLAGKPVTDVSPSSLTCALRARDCPANCTCQLRPATRSLELDCEAEPSEYPDPENHGMKVMYLRLRSIRSLSLPSSIVSLNLTGVGLTQAPPLNLEKIQELDLSHNHLTTAPLELLQSRATLYLSGNPFICNCPNFEDVLVLQKFKLHIADEKYVKCDSGESPWHVDAARLCDVRRAAIIGGTLAALGIIAALVAAFSYRYVLEIKVFLFTRGWFQSLIKEDELDKDAQYDAFVSFSEKDAKWVSEHLLPKLEGAPNFFKLCVHYRDWVLGDMIPAQIARSVEQSRRTIVVLSENFLKSTWAQLEFRTANIRAQRERRARVLVIVLGEVPDCEEMDAELRAYLATNTYLKWGDRWFWEKLVYAMPHKKTGYLNEVFVNDKLKNGGLNATLNADGKIINNVT